MLKNNDGFTLIELLIAIAISWVLTAMSIGIIICGNFWYSDDDVFRELKTDHPQITELLKTECNIFAKSVITVKENGINHKYCLDSDVLRNYKFSECQK